MEEDQNSQETFDRRAFVKHIYLIIDWIVILTSVTFFCKFAKTRNKLPGLYMIFILCILDVSYPVINFFATILVWDESSATQFGALRTGLNRASLYWSTTIAIHCYLILVKRKSLKSFQFMVIAGVCNLLASLLCPVILLKKTWGIHAEYLSPGLYRLKFTDSAESNPLLFFFFYDFIGTLLPVIIISFCYFKVYKFLRFLKSLAFTYSKVNTTKVLIYIFIPALCYLPQIISDVIFTSQKQSSPFWVAFLINTLRRSWGVLNLLAFWFTSVEGDENKPLLNEPAPQDLSLVTYK